MNRIFLTLLGLLIFPSPGFSAQSLYMHQPHISTRVMGMGGAFTAVADDYEALYYNAAGLARLESGELNLGIQAGITPSILSFYSDINSASKSNDVNQMTNVINNASGSHYASRVGLGGTLARPSWALGIQLLDLSVEADIHAVANIGLQAYEDSTIQFG